MSQTEKKFIANNAVGSAQARLENNSSLRARNAANSADIDLIKANASDLGELGVKTQSPFPPTAPNDLVNKSYADGVGTSPGTKNVIINSNLDIWQDGPTFNNPTSQSYAADMFRINYDGTIGTFAVTREAFTLGQTDVPYNPSYYLRWNQTAAGSGSTVRSLQIPVARVRTFAGGDSSFSIYLKADAARTVGIRTVQNFGTGGSPSADVVSSTQSVNVTTGFTQFQVSLPMASISGKTLGTNNDDYIYVELLLPVNVTMTIDVAQLMWNYGTTFASWQYYTGGVNYDQSAELSACEQFYCKSYETDTIPGTATTDGSQAETESSGSILPGQNFPSTMFKDPVVTLYAAFTGTINNVSRNSNSTDAPVQSVISSKKGFTYILLSANNDPGNTFVYHWVSNGRP